MKNNWLEICYEEKIQKGRLTTKMDVVKENIRFLLKKDEPKPLNSNILLINSIKVNKEV